MIRKSLLLGGAFALIGPVCFSFKILPVVNRTFWLFPFVILTIDSDMAYSVPVQWLIYIGAVLFNVAFYSAIGAGLGWIAKRLVKR